MEEGTTSMYPRYTAGIIPHLEHISWTVRKDCMKDFAELMIADFQNETTGKVSDSFDAMASEKAVKKRSN